MSTRAHAHAPVACLIVLVAGLAIAAAGCAHPPERAPQGPAPGGGRESAAKARFLERIDEYVALHRNVESTLPALPASQTSEQVDARQRALSRLIEQERARAEPGDIFSSDIRAYFRTLLRRVLAGPDGAQLRSTIMDENPGRIQLRINGRYPDAIPLSTMPYQVLAALPPLPEELEYRFIGDRLVLLDAHAHMVVDYIDDAL